MAEQLRDRGSRKHGPGDFEDKLRRAASQNLAPDLSLETKQQANFSTRLEIKIAEQS